MTNLMLDCEAVNLTNEQFFQLCINNRNFRFERNHQGDLIIMSPTGGETGNRNAGINAQLWIWNEEYELGKVFDSSTGFILPNGANRSPDASWIPLKKWEQLTTKEKRGFLPLAPDFVVELLSPSDQLKNTQAKMKEYMENGTKLGWLIHRKTQKVEIYRINKKVEILNKPKKLSGEDILPNFVLKLKPIW